MKQEPPQTRRSRVGIPVLQGGEDVNEWPATLDTLLALRPDVVVPGHGDPVDRAFVATRRAELAEVAVLHAAIAAVSDRRGHRRTTLALPQPSLGRRGPGER